MFYVATLFAVLACVTLAEAEKPQKTAVSDSKVMRRESSRAKHIVGDDQAQLVETSSEDGEGATSEPAPSPATAESPSPDTPADAADSPSPETPASPSPETEASPSPEAKDDDDDITDLPPTPAPTDAPTPADANPEFLTGPQTALERKDLEYSYIEETASAACDDHYEFHGMIKNEECAKKCYETYGCTRFSAGGCSLGCRISVPGKNNGHGRPVPPDGQCPTSDNGVAGDCIVYQLSFFHATQSPASCSNNYQFYEHADTKAECAHACKNTPGCMSFTAEPNCIYGCRISKGGKCSVKTEDEYGAGCTGYELFR